MKISEVRLFKPHTIMDMIKKHNWFPNATKADLNKLKTTYSTFYSVDMLQNLVEQIKAATPNWKNHSTTNLMYYIYSEAVYTGFAEEEES